MIIYSDEQLVAFENIAWLVYNIYVYKYTFICLYVFKTRKIWNKILFAMLTSYQNF